MVKVRRPYNAGSWYAGSREVLLKQLEEECFLHPLGPGKTVKQASLGLEKFWVYFPLTLATCIQGLWQPMATTP
jgi:predicted class III extradiol MEMO1 family dioxygenase